jgi:hypothetical protein
MPASSLHLTGTGRLWMAWFRMLLLRSDCCFAAVDESAAAACATDGDRGVLDSSAPTWRRRGH